MFLHGQIFNFLCKLLIYFLFCSFFFFSFILIDFENDKQAEHDSEKFGKQNETP